MMILYRNEYENFGTHNDGYFQYKFSCPLCKHLIKFVAKSHSYFCPNVVNCNFCHVKYFFYVPEYTHEKMMFEQDRNQIYTCSTRFLRKYNRGVFI